MSIVHPSSSYQSHNFSLSFIQRFERYSHNTNNIHIIIFCCIVTHGIPCGRRRNQNIPLLNRSIFRGNFNGHTSDHGHNCCMFGLSKTNDQTWVCGNNTRNSLFIGSTASAIRISFCRINHEHISGLNHIIGRNVHTFCQVSRTSRRTDQRTRSKNGPGHGHISVGGNRKCFAPIISYRHEIGTTDSMIKSIHRIKNK